jgi:hypothetical protein
VSVALAIVAPAAMIAVWARWAAPRSAHRLERAPRVALQAAVFVIAAVALAAAGRPVLAGVFAVVVVVNLALVLVWRQ